MYNDKQGNLHRMIFKTPASARTTKGAVFPADVYVRIKRK